MGLLSGLLRLGELGLSGFSHIGNAGMALPVHAINKSIMPAGKLVGNIGLGALGGIKRLGMAHASMFGKGGLYMNKPKLFLASGAIVGASAAGYFGARRVGTGTAAELRKNYQLDNTMGLPLSLHRIYG